jgi:hypothetical protein
MRQAAPLPPLRASRGTREGYTIWITEAGEWVLTVTLTAPPPFNNHSARLPPVSLPKPAVSPLF